MLAVAEVITPLAKIGYEKSVLGVVVVMGFDSDAGDLSSVDSKGLCDMTPEVLVRITSRRPGITFGYASDETEDCMDLCTIVVLSGGTTFYAPGPI